jgi:hypothetical protein
VKNSRELVMLVKHNMANHYLLMIEELIYLLMEQIKFHVEYLVNNIVLSEVVRKDVGKLNQVGKNLYEDHMVLLDNCNLFERQAELAFVVDDVYDCVNDVMKTSVVREFLDVDIIDNYVQPSKTVISYSENELCIVISIQESDNKQNECLRLF